MTMVTPRLWRALDSAAERGFARRVVTIEPGSGHDYDAREWRDALVVVTGGSLEIEGACGGRLTLRRGDVLWLADLPVRRLHNPGASETVLVAVSRPTSG